MATIQKKGKKVDAVQKHEKVAPCAHKPHCNNTGNSPCRQQTTTKTKKSTTEAPHNNKKTTKIVAHINIGWGQQLFLRGEGPLLSWDKGVPMKNLDDDTWEWSSPLSHKGFEFKVLLGDTSWSLGENSKADYGKTTSIHPQF